VVVILINLTPIPNHPYHRLSYLALQAWVTENSGWLRPYAAFCFLRDLFQV
jgi:hypothetical protein